MEIGGGGGSVTQWLCERVGPSGRVVATDINTRFLDTLEFPNLEVRARSIVEDELEEGAFDLVHTRAVLFHLSERDKGLERMVAALKPGSVLLVEEPDYSSWVADPRFGSSASDLFSRAQGIAASASTADLFYGRRLYGDVCALGLHDVRAEGRVAMGRGGSLYAEFQRLTTIQVRDRILETGAFTPEDLEAYLALFDDPNFLWMGAVLMAVSGRSPA